MGIKTFFLAEYSGLLQFSLRRHSEYLEDNDEKLPKCADNRRYHDAITPLGRYPVSFAPEAARLPSCRRKVCTGDFWSHDDPKWPVKCEHCSYSFGAEDEYQFFVDHLYQRVDTQEVLILRDAPVGAMWFADWMEFYKRESCDGHVLCVRLPGRHDWMPEQRASNCDSPCATCGIPYQAHSSSGNSCWKIDETAGKIWSERRQYIDSKPHKCWVRHGTPPGEVVHVDKSGVTCGAGAGSIAIPGWHGFLHNGELV